MDMLAGFVSYVSGQAAYEENARSAHLQAEIAALRERLESEAPFALETTSAGGLQCRFTFSDAGVGPSSTFSDFDEDPGQLSSSGLSSGSTSTSSSSVDSEELPSIPPFEEDPPTQNLPASTKRPKQALALSTSDLSKPSVACLRPASTSSMRVRRKILPTEPVGLEPFGDVDLGIIRRLFDLRWTLAFYQIPRIPSDHTSHALLVLYSSKGVPPPAAIVHHAHSIDTPSGSPSTTPHITPRAVIRDIQCQEDEEAEDRYLPGAWRIDEPAIPSLASALLALCLAALLLAYQAPASVVVAHMKEYVTPSFDSTSPTLLD